MRIQKLLVVVVLVFFIIPCNVYSQFTNYTSKDGLTFNNVEHISEDDEGLIYIATFDGLNVFNGSEFKIYNPSNTEGFGLKIACTLPIKKGFVLIGTLDKGLFLMNKFKQQITPLYFASNNPEVSMSVTAMYKDSKNMIWLGLENGSIITFDSSEISESSSTRLKNSIQVTKTSGSIKSFIEVNNSILSSGKSSKITRIKTRAQNYLIDKPLELLNTNQVSSMVFLNNVLYFGTNKGLFQLDNVRKLDSAGTTLMNSSWRLKKSNIRSLSKNNGNLWVGTEGDGLYKLSQQGKELEHFFYSENKRNKLNSNYALYTYVDSNENLWIGTWYGGINMMSLNKEGMQSVFDSKNEVHLFSNIIWSIAEGPNKEYYLGTHGNGLAEYHLSDKNFTSIVKNDELKSISSMFFDQQTQLLFLGTWGHGVKVYDPLKKQLVTDRFNFDLLNNSRVYAITRSSENNLWFGSFSKGLFKYSEKEKRLEKIPLVDNTLLSNEDIRCFLPDKNKNQLWIGSINHGLFRVQFTENGNIKNIDHFTEFADTNKKLSVQNLFMDSNSTLWILCRNGIGQINQNNEPIELPLLKNSVTTGMAEDNNKNLWISTYKGAYLLNQRNQEAPVLLHEDTFTNILFNPDKDIVLLASDHGLLISPTNLQKQEKQFPKLIFSNLKILDQKISPQKKFRNKVILQKKLNYCDTIILPHFSQTFSLAINSINYGKNTEQKFRYRLKNFETSWNISNNRSNIASYTNVPSGEYELLVQTANNDNQWNANIRALTIIKKKPWWFTNLAFISYGLLLLFIIYMVYKEIRARIRIKQELVFEKIKQEREHELHQQKISFFTNISHDIRTPLTLIIGPLEEILSSGSVERNIKIKLQRMLKSSRMLISLVNQILDFRKADTGHLKLNLKQIELNAFIQNVYYQFNELAKNKEIDFNISIPDEKIILVADPHKLESILFNLLSNALKFTSKYGQVTIHIATDSQFVKIHIADSGIGIPESEKSNIFNRFQQSTNTPLHQGTGIGMALVKKYVELHGGTIKVESEENVGSEFTLKFQLNKDYKEYEVFESFLSAKNNISLQLPKAETKHKKHKVLVVDDNPDIREYLHEILNKEYRVLSATNGNEALSIVNKKTPDLVISDIMMDGMNGIELCEKIKTNINTSHIPVILLTAKNSMDSRIEGFEKGADAYLEKPFNSKLLLTRVSKLINHRESLKKRFLFSTSTPSETTPSSVDEKFIDKIITHIHNNISESDFSIQSLADKNHISQDQLYRKIKALTGLSTNHFIRLIRLKYATKLLASKNYTINEVVFMVGFNNPSYFTRCFKTEFGMLPSEYDPTKEIN